MFKQLMLVAVLAVAPLAVHAQAKAVEHPQGHTGALVSYSDADVTVREKDGQTVVVAMTSGWTVATARAIRIDAIRPGDFVATINADIDAGSGRANELRLFEPGYRPELGTHAMPQPETSITHGTVSAVRKMATGLQLDVVYPEGSRLIQVPSTVKPIAYDLQARDFAQPGMTVTAVTRRDADGVWRAGRIVAQP
jgi:urease gamma subunit